MASYERFWWEGADTGLTRRDRRPCEYHVYLPDTIAGRTFTLEGEVAAEVSDAEQAITRFDADATALADTEALARLLLRAESIASSKIEGLEVGGARLLRAAVAEESERTDITAVEVLGNIEAMQWAVTEASKPGKVSVETVLGIHERLLRGTRLADHAGKLREEQNWIGGSSYNPCSADFVPPPPEMVPDLLEDLVTFLNDDSLPAVVQAAIAHSQFETVHPFADGNGRTGRALIHVVLRRRGLSLRAQPPLSLILATRSDDYVRLLDATRYDGQSRSEPVVASLNEWIGFFAAACRRSVADAEAFEQELSELVTGWTALVEPIRADSAVRPLLKALPGIPVVTASTAAATIGRSFEATNNAIQRLVQAGILKQVSVGRRNRAFEAPEVIDRFTALERRLASPTGDTQTAKPVRSVPYRRVSP